MKIAAVVPAVRGAALRPAAVQSVGADGAGRFAVGGVAVWMWGAQRSLTPWLWGLVGSRVLAHAPVRTPWQPIGVRLLKGRCTTSWLFCWLLCGVTMFEKVSLPVGTAGFEPATP